MRVSGFREAILIFARRGIEVVFELNGLCLMAQKDDAAVRKAWGLFSIYKPHHLVNYSLHKRIDKLEAVVKSPVAKNLGRIKNASNKRLGKVVEMNFQSLSVN